MSEKINLPIEVRVDKAHLPEVDVWEVQARITGIKTKAECERCANQISEYFWQLGFEMRKFQ